MKARKMIGVLLAISAISFTLWVLMTRVPNTDILLTNAIASPLENDTSNLAVFVDITNSGPPDRLVSVSSPSAVSATLSGSDSRRIIPANTEVSLAADGMYIILSVTNGELQDGRTLPLSLTFEKAGTLTTRARLVAPTQTGAAPDFGLFGIGDVCQVGEGEPAPAIEVVAMRQGLKWKIEVLSEDFEFTPHLADGPHVPGTGHGHLYLNGMKLGRLYTPSTTIGKLPPGVHDIRVTLSTNDHRAYVVGDQPITAAIRILVD
ncbi:copper chaperone PCu(A)C [Shimia marina]|uniref:Copper(I)-binding protein n=1 Tax=Shimia marina TaxID=321267 RepID=A0A0N7LSH0_9RHOB|nr:copper chaperone PCu(A)C [Shimia marina]CUH53596.1 hypothetical protein SHM7688_03050 [Shimia marina]SFD73282.1 Copper(I)-binding protein [Shimia marina]